jgi:hypothetical protein
LALVEQANKSLDKRADIGIILSMSFSTPSPHRLNDFATDLVLANPNPCGNCGPWPCYHICPNSPHFYTPEQERYDEANFDRSEYYREAGYGDPDLYPDIDYYDEAFEGEAQHEADEPFDGPAIAPVDTNDDLPF